jgi:magnesium transporter
MCAGKIYVFTDASDSVAMLHDPAYVRAWSRMGAIVVTFLIELIVAFQISEYVDTLEAYPLLISFLPVISAVSGNVGLQAGSLTARGIEVGTVKMSDWRAQVAREMSCGLIMASLSALLFFAVAGSWAGSQKFGVVIAFCAFCSTVVAAFFGTIAPIMFKHAGTDPIVWAGPLETGLQDVMGNTAFLYLAQQLLQSWVYTDV